MKKELNNLEIVDGNPLNCMLLAGESRGRVKLTFSRTPTELVQSTRVTDLPSDFKFFISE